MNDAKKVADALLNYPLRIYDTNPADNRYFLYGKEGYIVHGEAVVVPDFRLRDETQLPKVTDTPSMPPVKDPMPDTLSRKEVISIRPGDVIVAKFTQTLSLEGNDLASESLGKLFPNNQSVILDSGSSLEVYREQEKLPNQRFTYTKDGIEQDPPPPPPKRKVRQGM